MAGFKVPFAVAILMTCQPIFVDFDTGLSAANSIPKIYGAIFPLFGVAGISVRIPIRLLTDARNVVYKAGMASSKNNINDIKQIYI
jgi:hypothetical protein